MRTRDENKELAIREKALEMAVKEGFDGLSMQKLAKAAGVSPATIYIYFKDRDDLILQLWLQEVKKMVDATLKGFDPDMPFNEGLKIQWMNRARFCMENPASMHFLEQIKFSPYHEICMKKMDNTFLKAMSQFVHNAINRKEVVKLQIEVYWSVAFAPLYQLVKMHMSGRGLRGGTEKFVLDDKIMNQTLKLVLKALKP
ncbi:MAG TPA: TetR/AcrR family transcriptional regulator [Chryseolinea sp.]|nr:TetR/AcrR family transcriptional regulator [Chryseolinea sp.]